MRIFVVALLMFSAVYSFADSYLVKGVIIENNTGLSIEGVAVSYQLNGKSYSTLTDSLGRYEILCPQKTALTLEVSHLNYKSQSRKIENKKNVGIVNVDFELMDKAYMLGEVVVKARKPQVYQKDDTTVIDMESLEVHDDATLGEALGKAQGVNVRDNKVEINGKNVESVQVDGKEYFSDDIGMVIKNLQADMIKTVQVFEQMSDHSLLTGFDDGSRKTTMNIKTKEGADQSVVGKAYAGYGLDNYYKAYGMLNWFNGNRRLSIFSQANDIGEQNFSMIDLLSITGTSMNTAPQQSPYNRVSGDNSFHPTSSNISDMMVSGYSAGETTTKAIGVNYSDVLGKSNQVAFSGHYMFNNAINETDYEIQDDYYSEDANTSLQAQQVRTDNTNHRFNMKMTWNISDEDNILFRPSIIYQRQKEYSNLHVSEENVETLDVAQMLEQEQNTDQEAFLTSNELIYIHKFSEWGSSLSANLRYSFENTDEDLNLSLKNLQGSVSGKTQTTWSQNQSQGYAAVGSYIHPFGSKFRTKIDAGWRATYRTIKRHTQRNDTLNIAMMTDSILSGKTTSDYGGPLCGLSLLFDSGKKEVANQNQGNVSTQIVAGLEYHWFRMNSANDMTTNFHEVPAILPYFHLRHQWGARDNQLHFQYKTDQIFPTTQQLQDAINNVNPTVAIRGNVYLKPSYSHSTSLRLIIPGKNGGTFVFFANASLIGDYIANKRSVAGGALGAAETRSQLMSYENTDGYWSGSALLAYGFPLKKKLNMNVSTMLRYSHVPGFWESEKSFNNQFNWSSGLTIGSNISKNIDFVIDSNLQYNNDKNISHPTLDVNYWTYSFGGQVNWQFLPHFKVVAECGRTIYDGLGTNGLNATICNLALAYKFLKNNSAEIRLSCDDVLNKNNYFTLQTNELFRRKTIANVIGRHALLTFTYKLNTINK